MFEYVVVLMSINCLKLKLIGTNNRNLFLKNAHRDRPLEVLHLLTVDTNSSHNML